MKTKHTEKERTMKEYPRDLKHTLAWGLLSILGLLYVTTGAAGTSGWEVSYQQNMWSRTLDSTADGGALVTLDERVIKLDTHGVEQWQQGFPANGLEYGFYDSHQTSDGGYVAAGSSSVPDAEYGDLYVRRMNADGTTRWEYSSLPSGAYDSEANGVAETEDGGFVVAADAVGYRNGYWEDWLVVLKLDQDGQKEWARAYYDMGTPNSIQQTTDGGFILGGFRYVVKLAANGDVQWTLSPFADAEYYSVGDLQVQQTDDGGYIVAGSGDLPCLPDGAGLLLKLDAEGTVVWKKFFHVPLYAIEQTTDHGYIVAGRGEIYLQETWKSGVIAMKLDTTGNIQWQKLYAVDDDINIEAVSQLADGGYALLSTLFVGPTIENWVLKIGPQGEAPDDCTCDQLDAQVEALDIDIPMDATSCSEEFVIYWWDDGGDEASIIADLNRLVNALYWEAAAVGIPVDQLNLEESNELETYFPPWTDLPFDISGNITSLPAGQYGYASDPRWAPVLNAETTDDHTVHITRLFGAVWGVAEPYRLSIDPPLGGQVTSTDGLVNCGTSCEAGYPLGTAVSLQAIAEPDHRFIGWTGDCAQCTGNSCSITMDADKICSALFESTTNEPPVIDAFAAQPVSGAVPLSTTLTCQAHDPDGAVAVYEFDFGDGSEPVASEAGQASHTYQDPGNYQASCTAYDDREAPSDPVTVAITVAQPSWQEITGQLQVSHSPHQLYDRLHRVFFSLITVKNPGAALAGPIRMVIVDPSLPVQSDVGTGLEPDGFTDEGYAYFVIVPDGGTLGAGETLSNLRVNFPLQHKRLTYGVRIEQLR